MSEMQECLHEEKCRRREVRLCQLQGVSDSWAGCPVLSQMLCTRSRANDRGAGACCQAGTEQICMPAHRWHFGETCRRTVVGR